MWAQDVTWQWYMKTLNTYTWSREDDPDLGLTDKDVGFLRMMDCDIKAQDLIKIDRTLVPIKCTLFFGILSRKTL